MNLWISILNEEKLLFRSDRGANVHEYQANLKSLAKVDTVHQFWEVYNGSLPAPDKLPPRTR